MNVTVSADVPFGNVCCSDVSVEKDKIVVSFMADPHRGPEALWFCFRITRKAEGGPERMVLRLLNSHNTLGGGFAEAIAPVTRTAGGEWVRLESGVRINEEDGRYHAQWECNVPDDYLDIAFCYPYGPDEVDRLVAESDGYWRKDAIGVSQGGRPIERLSNSYGEPEGTSPGIYIISRQHSAETPGSWVLDGFLRYCAAVDEQDATIWCVPLTNVDGVMQGDYGKDNFPRDLNRAWGTPPMRYEVQVLMLDMQRLTRQVNLKLGLDFHAPGGSEKYGIYHFSPDPEKHPEWAAKNAAFSVPIRSALTEQFADSEFNRVARYPSRWSVPGEDSPTFTHYCFDRLGICGMTFETTYAFCGDLLMTRDDYREAGKRIAEAVLSQIKDQTPTG